MTTAFTVVIPSRYASTRLPGKPLQMIGDKPMVQLVWEALCREWAAKQPHGPQASCMNCCRYWFGDSSVCWRNSRAKKLASS